MRALMAATLMWGCTSSESGPPDITRPEQTTTTWSTGSPSATSTTQTGTNTGTSTGTNTGTNIITDTGLDDSGTPTITDTTDPNDRDGDGVANDEDCEPDNPAAYPGALEFCDRVDNDCDGVVDYGSHALRLEPGASLRSDLPLAELSSATGALTVEFWVRVVTDGGAPIEWSGDEGGFKTIFDEDVFPTLEIDNGSDTFTSSQRDSLLPDTWTHVTLMVELTKDDEIAMFLNGVPNSYERIFPSSFLSGRGISGENYLWFGGSEANSDIYLDEIRIWNAEFVRADIMPRMCEPLNGDEEGLVGYWPIEDDYNADLPASGTMSVFSGSPEIVEL